MKQETSLDCPFCGPFDNNDTSRLFSFGFQGLGICSGCVNKALSGALGWRWTGAPGECLRCQNKQAQVLQPAPGKLEGLGSGIGVCLKCLKAGHRYLIGAEAVPETQPQKPTREERTTGNL